MLRTEISKSPQQTVGVSDVDECNYLTIFDRVFFYLFSISSDLIIKKNTYVIMRQITTQYQNKEMNFATQEHLEQYQFRKVVSQITLQRTLRFLIIQRPSKIFNKLVSLRFIRKTSTSQVCLRSTRTLQVKNSLTRFPLMVAIQPEL